ncbi:hypothetical protein HY945_03705 [Candidatus Gottesmanbacteria bacterium]|nr:hypothetical protein [Candidatus Gottesmanbacteria bacterium]
MSQAIETKFRCHHLIEAHYEDHYVAAFKKPVVVFVDEAIAGEVKRDASTTPEGSLGRCLAPGRDLCDHRCIDDVRIVVRSGSLKISPIYPIEPRK